MIFTAKKYNKVYSSPLPRNGLQPLLDFMFKITQNDFFKHLDSPDGAILQGASKRKERQQKKDVTSLPKKQKLCFAECDLQEINTAANAVSSAGTPQEVEDIIKKSR